MPASAELRWFWKDNPPQGLENWFCSSMHHGFTAGGSPTKARIDVYALDTDQGEVGIKYRGAKSGLEIKSQIGIARGKDVVPPFSGPIELWTKLSTKRMDLAELPMVAVTKYRRIRKFDTSDSTPAEVELDEDGQPAKAKPPSKGCNVELTKIHVTGDVWWTFAFEAFGPLDMVADNLQRVAKVLVERPGTPSAGEFAKGQAASYPAWLQQQSAMLLERTAKLDGFFAPVEIDISWGDMDANRHVNNAVYFRYLETARVRYLSELGWDEYEPAVIPILGRVGAKFLQPLVYPGRIAIGTRPLALEDTKVVLEHAIVHGKHNNLMTLGKSSIVAFDAVKEKKTKLPDKVREAVDRQMRRG